MHQLAPSEANNDEKHDDGKVFDEREEEADDGSSPVDTDDNAVDADNDDDDNKQNWKKKIFGKKKIMRRKKYTNTKEGVGDGESSVGMDDSICAPSPHHQVSHPKDSTKQRRPPRQRAKVAMYPAKNLGDNSESDCPADRGLEPMDAAMEALLPQRRQMQRKHHSNPRRPDPPTTTTPQQHAYRQRRRKKKDTGDGYENSGHESGFSDFMFTEDDKSDFYVATEDDRDNDDDAEKDKGDDDDGLMDLYAATKKLSLGNSNIVEPEDKKPGNPSTENEKPSACKIDPQPQTQAQQIQPQPNQPQDTMKSTPITKPKKRRTPRKRTPKTKKSVPQTPQTVPEDVPRTLSMQEEEELNCHTPMKMPEKPRQQQQKNPDEQVHHVINEKDQQLHDAHEDEDDYPADTLATMKYCTPVKEEAGDNQHEESNNKHKAKEKPQTPPKRTLEEELAFLKRISSTRYQVQVGFVPNMKVPAEIIVNNDLQTLLVQELHDSCCGPKSQCGGAGAFIPALRQAANVAALPGIVRASLAMPDVHSGYGFCIGNVAAFDVDDPSSIISPGGVGFDINCGVRLIRTNLTEDDVSDENVREALAEALFKNIPVGVGAGGDIPCDYEELDMLLSQGIDWAVSKGYAWEEDREHCEENGRMDTADPKCVSHRAKKRGLKQLGTLGAGNHYAEIQLVDEVYHPEAAKTMGIGRVGQVCIMIHTGSRGLGHQVATDALQVMERAMARDNIELNDRQLSCARIGSKEGKEYLAAMSAAANFAWVNRSCITYLTRKAFSEVFERKPDDMDMHLVYDVCHNIAKVENHMIDGVEKTLLVHRKGSTRAFPPKHPNIPKDYQSIGQPVLIGGTMGTCSYVLVGTEKGMTETFGSTCHGAGRALSRNQSRKKLNHDEVLDRLRENGISIRVASPKLVTEEAPESYKDVCDVIETCQDAGISKKVVKLRPIAVIKG